MTDLSETGGALEEIPPHMTQAQYARHHGWSRTYVTNLKQAGRLVMVLVGGRELVDVKASDEKLEADADPAKGKNGRHAVSSEDPTASSDVDQVDSFKTFRTQREKAEAELKQLKLEEARGRLIDREVVEATLFAIFRTQRDRLTQMTGIIAKRVTTLDSEEDCAAVIREEIRKALNASADEFEREGLAQEGTLARSQ